jgi:quercetin dioxygenase-like cupin family protein
MRRWATRAVRAVLRPIAGAYVLASLLSAPTAGAADPLVLRLFELAESHPARAGAPATVGEVARGAQTSVNYWQIATEMPAHLHRTHEEVIVVESCRVETTVGDRVLTLGPGDVLVVPPGTVHAGRVTGSEPARGYSIFAPAFDGRDRMPAPPSPEPPAAR